MVLPSISTILYVLLALFFDADVIGESSASGDQGKDESHEEEFIKVEKMKTKPSTSKKGGGGTRASDDNGGFMDLSKRDVLF